jgi:hypothetical protein
MNRETADLMTFINTQLAMHLTTPDYRSVEAITEYARTTENPHHTLIVLVGILLHEQATLLTNNTHGPEAALNYVLEGIHHGKTEATE